MSSSQLLSKRLKAEDFRQQHIQHAVPAVRVATVVVTAAVAVLIAATETLAEIEVVLVLVYIVATVAVVGVLVDIRVLVVGTPPILTVSPSSPEAFLISVVHGLPQNIGAVLIDLVVPAGTMITIDRSRVEVRVMIVIAVPIVPEAYLLLAQTL